ncbi:MAG TPA: amino acid adenylation domain-containing protein [Streptosporangiaceae bacterium]|nr:amino acid adenylation domain-containing protein [Streptosporangiaceae bacterium]
MTGDPEIAIAPSGELAGRLARFADAERTTPAMVLLTACAIVLARYSRRTDVIVACELDGGREPRPVQIRVPRSATFSGVVRAVRDDVLDVLAGKSAALATESPDPHLPAFRMDDATTVALLRLGSAPWNDGAAPQFGAAVTQLLADGLARSASPVESLLLLTAADHEGVADAGRGAVLPASGIATLYHLFQAQAERTPTAEAVYAADGCLTYQDLDQRANRLAHYLRALGLGTESVVGLALPRSAAAIVALLAVTKCGAAFLPLDPAQPAARLAYILADAGVAALITDVDTERRLPPHRVPVIALDRATEQAALREAPDSAPPSAVHAENLAYVIYTSGSTGRPKGVEITHRGAVNLARVLSNSFGLDQHDRVAQFASLSFDASIWEMLMAFSAGSCLVIVPTDSGIDESISALREHAVTAGTFPPSFLNAADPESLPGLRLVVSAGERCPAEVAAAWSAGRRFVNAYGPTEATVCATFCEPSGPGDPPIGSAIPGLDAHVLGADLELLPAWVPGELHLAGAGLARSYRNLPGLSAASFVPNPFGPAGSRLYRTKDLSLRRPDGAIEHLGRSDHQIKLRGYRIEPGEIEATLTGHPGVSECVVRLHDDDQSGPVLVAYVLARAADTAAPGLAQAELRRFLAAALPDYLVPGRFVVLNEFPRNASGKADRAAIAGLALGKDAGADQEDAPATETEKRIAQIWAQSLGFSSVQRTDNFLEIGGHSLVAAQIIARTRASFELRRLPVRLLFEQPVLADFAAAVDDAAAGLAGARS